MAVIQDLIGAGSPVLLSRILGDDQVEGLTAAGTTRTDALALTKSLSVFSTVGSSTGAVLPSAAAQAQNEWKVFNFGSNTLSVYAAGANTINGVAGSTAVSIPANEGGLFVRIIAGTGWWFVPLGT